MSRSTITGSQHSPEAARASVSQRRSVQAPLQWRPVIAGACAVLALVQSPTSLAHVVLAQKAAPAGTYYRAQFMVGHGCAGSATVAVQVDIPDSVPVARPQPKAGWTLTYESGPLTEPAMVHGKIKTEGIRRVVWRGGPLPDEQYEEFGMMLFLAKPGRLHFRVLQTCEAGTNDWAGIAAEGGAKPAFPAATLDVFSPGGHGEGHHHPPQPLPVKPADQDHTHHH